MNLARLSGLVRSSGLSIWLTNSSSLNKTYAIDITTDLVNWIEQQDGHPSGGAETEYTDPNAADPERYYRLREE